MERVLRPRRWTLQPCRRPRRSQSCQGERTLSRLPRRSRCWNSLVRRSGRSSSPWSWGLPWDLRRAMAWVRTSGPRHRPKSWDRTPRSGASTRLKLWRSSRLQRCGRRSQAAAAGQPETSPAAPAAKAPVVNAPAVVAPPAEPSSAAKVPASMPAAPPAVEAVPGRVMVRSEPSGAQVKVDGRDRGTTPVLIEDLTRGSHRVQVMRDGYGTEERRVAITRTRSTLSLNVRLTRARVPAPRGATPASPGGSGGWRAERRIASSGRAGVPGRQTGRRDASRARVGAGR